MGRWGGSLSNITGLPPQAAQQGRQGFQKCCWVRGVASHTVSRPPFFLSHRVFQEVLGGSE